MAKTKSTVAILAQQLIAGTAKHLTTGTALPVAGGSYTPAQITTKLQQIVTLRTDVDAARAQTQAKLVAETTDMPPLRTFIGAFVAFVKAAYVNSPDVLADFGIHPKARTPLTVQAKAVAAAKRASTRAARHTMGKVQKKTVKGDVTGLTLTPTTAPQPVEATTPTATPTAGAPSPVVTSAPATPPPHTT